MTDTLTLSQAAEFIKGQIPNIWRVIHTRHIDSPGTHHPHQALAVGLTAAIWEALLEKQPPGRLAAANIAACAGILQKFDYPTYYVSRPLFEAMKRSRPPENFTWNDLKLPFDGLVFMIPRRSLLEQGTGDEILFIGGCHLPAQGHIRVPGTGHAVDAKWSSKEDRITVFWSLGPSGLTTQDVTFPASQKLIPDSKWIDEMTSLYEQSGFASAKGPDSTFTSYVSGLFANLVLVMQARKEILEPGARTGKRLKSGLQVYSPTFIGRNYQILRKDHFLRLPRFRAASLAATAERRKRGGTLARSASGMPSCGPNFGTG